MDQAVTEHTERQKLLLIDDSEITLAIEKAILSRHGFAVQTTSSLNSFLELLEQWRPHVVITDVHMPGMSGDELCRWLRKQMTTSRIPIVLCSSLPESQLREMAMKIGADAYVSKDNGLDDLGDRLQSLCDEILW